MDIKKDWETIKKVDTQKEEELSNASGSLKSKETEFLRLGSLHSGIVKFQMSILTKDFFKKLRA
jgi:uncharacterized protein (DUF2225 family)